MYRGNGANVLRLVPEVGFKFIVHDQFKIMFAPADGSPLGVAEKLAAGAATGTRGMEKPIPIDVREKGEGGRAAPGGRVGMGESVCPAFLRSQAYCCI